MYRKQNGVHQKIPLSWILPGIAWEWLLVLAAKISLSSSLNKFTFSFAEQINFKWLCF
jgi:hypothetical protein